MLGPFIGVILNCPGLPVVAASHPTQEISVPSEEYPEHLKATLDVPPGTLRRAESRTDTVNQVALGPVGATFAAGPSVKPGVPQIGFAREIPAALARRIAPSALRWTPVSGGRVAAFIVRSPGAAALRLGMFVQSLPNRAELKFFGSGDDTRVFGPVGLAEIRKATSFGQSGIQETYWSPVVEGDTAGVEIFVPTSAGVAAIAFTVPLVSHFVRRP